MLISFAIAIDYFIIFHKPPASQILATTVPLVIFGPLVSHKLVQGKCHFCDRPEAEADYPLWVEKAPLHCPTTEEEEVSLPPSLTLLNSSPFLGVPWPAGEICPPKKFPLLQKSSAPTV